MYRERSRTISNRLFNLIFTRAMGGGPRTFLVTLAGDGRPPRVYGSYPNEDFYTFLANQFIKEGAEDLWNEDDGPIECPPPLSPSNVRSSEQSGSIESPVDERKLISENGHSLEHNAKNEHLTSMSSMHYSVQSQISCRKSLFGGSSLGDSCEAEKPRHYSVQTGTRFRRNESSSSDNDSDYDSENGQVKDFVGNSRWERLSFKGGESSSDVDVVLRGKGNAQKMMSSAALGKYDVKIKRRVPLKSFDEGGDFSEQVELKKKNLMENEVTQDNEESLPNEKRFDECNVSPLTVKALSAAGYVQMTRVQEASLSVSLEGPEYEEDFWLGC